MESSWEHWDVAQQDNEEILQSNVLGSESWDVLLSYRAPTEHSSRTSTHFILYLKGEPSFVCFGYQLQCEQFMIDQNSNTRPSPSSNSQISGHQLLGLCCVLANHLEGTIEDAENSNSIIQGGWVPAFQNLGGQASQGAMFLFILVISTQYF